MILKSIAKNQTELHYSDKSILFSYETPVACYILTDSGRDFFKTTIKYSTTTTKHINQFISRHGGSEASEKPQEFFNDMLK